MLDSEKFLAHYGVKGMRWGVRKDRSRSYSKDYARARKLRNRARKSSIKSLTNSELEALNKRTQLEKKYADLNPNIIKTGYKWVTTALAVVGTVGTIVALSTNNPAIKKGREFLISRRAA